MKKKVEKTDTLPALDDTLASPDKRFMAGVRIDDKNMPEVTIIDVRDSRQPKIVAYSLDTSSLSGYDGEEVVSHKLDLVEWNRNDRYLILKHDYTLPDKPTATEWLWWDRESPESLINVSTLFNLPIKSLQFGEGRDVYLLQDNGDIRRGSTGDGTVTRPLISNATWFDIYDKTIAYLGLQNENSVAGVLRNGWKEPTVIASVPHASAVQLHIGVSNYFNKDTVAVSDGSTVKIYRGTLPSTPESREIFLQSPIKFTLNRPVNNIQFNISGRFVVAEDDSGLVIYDLERSMVSQDIKKYTSQPIRWMDGFYIWQADDNAELLMQEFDGMNPHKLLDIDAEHDAVLTQDGKYLYSLISTDDGSLELQRLSMIATN